MALTLLFAGAAPAVSTMKNVTPPIPSGFKLVASDRGNAASYWVAYADAFSVDNPVAIDVRVAGTGGKPATKADASCSDTDLNDLPDSKRVFKGFGLFTLPVPSGAANCGVTADATGGSSGAFTVQIYVQTGGAPATTTGTTSPTPTSPSKAYDGTWQGQLHGTVQGAPNPQGLQYRADCCDAWSFTVSDGKISGRDGTSGSISSSGAATITIASETADRLGTRSGPYSIPCTFQVQFTSATATSGPISCTDGSLTFSGDYEASRQTQTTTTTPTTTTPKTASANCVRSNDGSSNGWNYYKYVDTTSTAPCYGHWTITLGPGCQFDDGDGHGWRAASPSNVWNIVRWGFASGGTVAYLHDGYRLWWSCTINAASYAQTSLHSPDWG